LLRPSNEYTNGLLRQYFRKGTDLRVHGPEQLVAVAVELNARPRKTLGWDTPAGRLAASKHNDQPGAPSSGPASTAGPALRG
jgi:IS30 family transposase